MRVGEGAVENVFKWECGEGAGEIGGSTYWEQAERAGEAVLGGGEPRLIAPMGSAGWF